MVWYGIGEEMESAWSRYEAYLKNSTPALLHLDPHAYMRALTGFTQVRLISYTHGRHDRSSVRSNVWVNLLTAYSISPWIKQSLVVQFIFDKTYAMLPEDSEDVVVQGASSLQFMSSRCRFGSNYL